MDWRTRVKSWMAVHRLPAADRPGVLLTFDDGPHPDGTPAVLDVLRRYNARAVFFVVGSRIHRAPGMLTRVLDEGHVLGNHSFAHPLGRQLGLRACRKDIDRCQDLVYERTGRRPRLFRPPLGHFSAASLIAPRLAGLTPVFWSVDSQDWRLRASEDVRASADHVLGRLAGRPLQDILLFHDEQPLTARLLEIVLPCLVERHVDLRPAIGRGAWYLP